MKNSLLIVCTGIRYNGDGENHWYTPRQFIDYTFPITPDGKGIGELININRKILLEKVVKECRQYRPCQDFKLTESKWIIKIDVNDEITTTNRIYMENGN